MVAFAITTVALQLPLHTMAIFACFWTLIPAVVQLIILVIIVMELYKDDAKLKDINQWWSTFGLISSMCFHFYAVYLSISIWTSEDDKCFDNGKQCVVLTLLFEFVGLSWIAMMGLAYHSCFKRVFTTRGITGHHHHGNHDRHDHHRY
ncbi:hypothetical protein FO519_008431 [Halicephalobus sp. NKZ332]|nr:hypothetical protein FO519_008431 [Halicephalobus sp. NKZ332]